LKRQVQIQSERRSNGDPTPEMLALMRCCVAQTEANERIFAERSKRAFAPEARMNPHAVRDVHKVLGVTATERPAYEDPERLRQGRAELGLGVAL
jgi:hypothetical protein